MNDKLLSWVKNRIAESLPVDISSLTQYMLSYCSVLAVKCYREIRINIRTNIARYMYHRQIWRWPLTHNNVQCWGDRVIWANCGVAYTVSRTCFKNTFHGSGVQKWPKSISHNSLWRLTYENHTFIFNFCGIRGQ